MNQTLQKVLDEVRSRYAFRDAMAMQTGKAKGWLGCLLYTSDAADD